MVTKTEDYLEVYDTFLSYNNVKKNFVFCKLMLH